MGVPVPLVMHEPVPAEPTRLCQICNSCKPMSTISSFSCDHAACTACVRGRLSQLLGQGSARVTQSSGQVRCSMLMPPYEGCGEPLSQQFVQAHVSDEHYQVLLRCESEALQASFCEAAPEPTPSPGRSGDGP